MAVLKEKAMNVGNGPRETAAAPRIDQSAEADAPQRGGGDAGYGKAFLLSARAGAAFGLIASIIYLQVGEAPWHPAFFSAGLALLSGFLAGLAGLGGTYLDQVLLLWGIKKPLLRMGVSFAALALVIYTITYTGATVLGVMLPGPGQRYSVWMMLAGLVFGAVFALINYRAERQRQRLHMLELENRHLADLALREELLREAARNLAVAEERNRMARELHDSISQGMHGIVYALRSLRGALDGNPRGLAVLGHLEQTAGATLQELRRLIMELNPSPLDEHSLAEALRLHCDIFARRQQITLDFCLGYTGGLQPEQEVALYRIAQEALANIQQHAFADRLHVALKSENESVILTIRDNGRGFNPTEITGGHGLKNMAARARQSGGRIEILSRPGSGTAVSVTVPLQ
ncbi:MAG: sensor histidine kinase [Bacillota bacterium]